MFGYTWRRVEQDSLSSPPHDCEDNGEDAKFSKSAAVPIEVSPSGAPIPSARNPDTASASSASLEEKNPAIFSSANSYSSRESLRKYLRVDSVLDVTQSRLQSRLQSQASESEELKSKLMLNETNGTREPPSKSSRTSNPDSPEISGTKPKETSSGEEEDVYAWSWRSPTSGWFSRPRSQEIRQEEHSDDTSKVQGTSTSAPKLANDLNPDSETSAGDKEARMSKPWGFWSRKPSSEGAEESEEGELAIYGTETARDPQAAIVTERRPGSSQSTRQNIVVPHFDCLPVAGRGSRLLRYLGVNRPRQMIRGPPSSPKKVVVIGVHGYFPTRMTRVFLGEPKGTSIKFANEAARRVEKWAHDHSLNVEIERIALEGEGRINNRVTRLYQLLLNWKSSIEAADFVFFAAHSQGAVVTVQILRHLVLDGHLPSSKRVVLLAMAGTYLGPMPGMDRSMVMKAIKTVEHDSLMELFQLQDPSSPLSRDLITGLHLVLEHGIKMVLVGSADDQLVPLYSALCIQLNHPNLYRAAYLDGDDVAPEVIAPLLDLALRHRNFGLTDHGLVSELSAPLAGALTSKGHSKLYSSDSVYDLAIEVGLETMPCTHVAPVIKQLSVSENPYVLPWATHALVATAESRTADREVLRRLYEEFAGWKPRAKPMKDVKFRLSALQSKL